MEHLIVLYRDASPASAEAEVVLQKAHLDALVIFVDEPEREGKPVPRLLASEGFFDTLEDIRWYAQVYGNGVEKRL